MRYAIVSDIHSNLEALTAVLEDLATQHIDRLLCLGDSMGYGADPSLCLTRLEGSQAIGVCGNHEWGCLGKLDLRWFNDAARRALEWTRDQLSFTDLDALRRLPLTATEGSLTLVHSTLVSPQRFEYLVEAGQGIDCARVCRTLICCVGHSHVPFVFEIERPAYRLQRFLVKSSELDEVRVATDPQRWRYLVNPGSVGQPRDGDPRASYAVFDDAEGRLHVRRVPYDIKTAQAKIRQAGLPEFLADRLAVGR